MSSDLEKEMNIERLRVQIDFLQQAIFQKASTPLVLASLSAAILIIATFSKEILNSNTIYFNIAITILLSMIPLSLLAFLYEITSGIKGVNKNVIDIIGVDMQAQAKEDEKDNCFCLRLANKACVSFPYLGTALLTLVIVYIIIEIWRN